MLRSVRLGWVRLRLITSRYGKLASSHAIGPHPDRISSDEPVNMTEYLRGSCQCLQSSVGLMLCKVSQLLLLHYLQFTVYNPSHISFDAK
jgi:hypothetical protein